MPLCTDADNECVRPRKGDDMAICFPETLMVSRAVATDPTDEGDEGTLGEVGGVSNAGAGNTPLADIISMACHGLLIDGE